MDALGPALQIFEQVLVRAGEEGLETERRDFIKQCGPSSAVQVRCNFI